MEIVEGDIEADLIQTGLTRDIIVGAPVGMLPKDSNAARDFLTKHSHADPDSFQILPGNVKTIELDAVKLPGGRPNPFLHIITTHQGANWDSAEIAVESGFNAIHDIIMARGKDSHGMDTLAAIGKGIDFDNLSTEDAELLKIFGDAALGPIAASVLIGAGSAVRGQNVPLRAILAAMARSKLGGRTKVVLKTDPEPALVKAGILPVSPLMTAVTRKRALQALDLVGAKV